MKNFFESLLRSIFRTASVGVAVASLAFVIVLALVIFNLVRSLPDVNSLKTFHHELATEVYSDEGRKIGEFTTEQRYPVKFESVPQHVIHAFLAAEDSNFYEHKGIDFNSILRAVFSNLLKGRYAQGGSTITQQVARNILLMTRKKDLTRKFKEILLAKRMEKELSKNEILSLYLSEIYLGHGAYGIGAAANGYFGKKVEDLTIAEGALIAGLPQRPVDWDPFRNPNLAKRRQLYVLKRMHEEKFITDQQLSDAKAQALKLYTAQDFNNTAAPYFTEYVRQYLMNKYGSGNVLRSGYKVYTTVRYEYQKSAEKSLEKGIRAVDKRLGWRGAKEKMKTREEAEILAAQIHEDALERATNVRILPPDADQTGLKKLPYDISSILSKGAHYGNTPVQEGEYYKAIVNQLDDSKGLAKVVIGQTTAELPLSSLNWVLIEEKPITKVSQVLQVGDVVAVSVEKIDRKIGQVTVGLEQEPEVQGAILTYDLDSGSVRAMVGGRDFVQSKFNRALNAKRQVGSTFKPVVYAAAVDRGFSPASLVTDAPLVFKFEGKLDADNQGEDWRPRNYSGKFEGDIPLRLALVRSMNIPTVKILNEISIDYGIQYARSLGISAVLPRDLSIALGSWSSSLEEITRAYAVFPRLGKPIELHYIKKVIDEQGNVIEDNVSEREPAGKQKLPPAQAQPELAEQGLVITPQTAYVMTDMLRGVIREGTGTAALSVPAPVAGKTGTSNDHRDAWFIGFTPHVMTGVWVGYDKDRPLDPGETGGKAAAPIWSEYMQQVVKDYPRGEFPIPDDVVFAYIDRYTGRLANAQSPNRVRVAFKVGTVPTRTGDNLPRIGEPGVRATSTTTLPHSPDDKPGTSSEAPVQKEEETSDFIREGYQD